MGRVWRLGGDVAGEDVRGAGRPVWVEVREAAGGVGGVHEPRPRRRMEVWITQVLGTVRIGAALRLHHPMHQGRAAKPKLADVHRGEHVEQLHQQHAAGRWRRHRDDLMATVDAARRLAPDGTVRRQVRMADEAAAALHLGHQQVCRRAVVEAALAMLLDALQRGGQVRLREALAGGGRRPGGGGELRRRGRMPGEAIPLCRQLAGHVLGQGEPIAGQCDRRFDHCRQRQFAVALLHVEQAGHGAGDAHRQVRMGGEPVDDLAGRVQVHVPPRLGGCAFPVVIGDHLAAGQPDHHEATAADIAGGRIGDRQREAGGHRGVDGVAAPGQDVRAHFRGERRAGHHHASGGAHRFWRGAPSERRDHRGR